MAQGSVTAYNEKAIKTASKRVKRRPKYERLGERRSRTLRQRRLRKDLLDRKIVLLAPRRSPTYQEEDQIEYPYFFFIFAMD
jgi:hypothetical protein